MKRVRSGRKLPASLAPPWLLPILACCLTAQAARAQTNVVRLLVVNTPEEGGLLRDILPDFERQTGLRVTVYSGEDVYDRARVGQADLVISHYGHAGVEAFMADGLGQWPRPIFANQNAIIGPASDPANIFNLADATEAFRRIAASRSPFVVNNSGIPKYTEDILWEAAGRPSKEGGWYIDTGLREQRAVETAAQRGAYVIWGLLPFLRFREQSSVPLRVLVVNDALLNRMMVSIVMRPEKFPDSNVEGAKALERYLLLASTQARIRASRYPGLDHALWWPSARNNSTAALGYAGEGMGQQPAPAIHAGGIVNNADRKAAVRPGAIVEIYGTNLAVATCVAGDPPWPTQLPCSPTRVAIDGRQAPLLYVTPLQVNAQIPMESPPGSVSVTVIRGGLQSNPVAITLSP